MRGQSHSLSNTPTRGYTLTFHGAVPGPQASAIVREPHTPVGGRGFHCGEWLLGDPRLWPPGRGPEGDAPHLLGNWGSSWPSPELPDWLTLLHCPRRWGLHGGPQEHTVHSLPHRTKGRASGWEDHGGGLVRPLPRRVFTARLHRAAVLLGSLCSSESRGCSLSSLIIWTVTKEKRDS